MSHKAVSVADRSNMARRDRKRCRTKAPEALMLPLNRAGFFLTPEGAREPTRDNRSRNNMSNSKALL
jgi:hypothetical protein